MRVEIVLATVILCACAETEVPGSEDAWDGVWNVPPPAPGDVHPEALDARVSGVFQGRNWVVSVPNGVGTGMELEVITGTAGPGPCPPALGGLCLGIETPLRRRAVLQETPRGFAALVEDNPWRAGDTVSFQVVGLDPTTGTAATSPVITRRVQAIGDVSGAPFGRNPCFGGTPPPATRDEVLDDARACSSRRWARGTCEDDAGVSYDVIGRVWEYDSRIHYFALDGSLALLMASTDYYAYCGGRNHTIWRGLPIRCDIEWDRTERCPR